MRLSTLGQTCSTFNKYTLCRFRPDLSLGPVHDRLGKSNLQTPMNVRHPILEIQTLLDLGWDLPIDVNNARTRAIVTGTTMQGLSARRFTGGGNCCLRIGWGPFTAALEATRLLLSNEICHFIHKLSRSNVWFLMQVVVFGYEWGGFALGFGCGDNC